MAGKFCRIILSGTFRETGALSRGLSPGGRRPDFRYDLFLCRIEAVLRDRSIRRILVDCREDFRVPFPAGLEGIHREFRRLAESGRELTFHARDYGTAELYLASACPSRTINLCGGVSFPGLSMAFPFYKGFLDKQGISVQVFRRGAYKSAGDSFRLKKLDGHNREQYRAFQETFLEELTGRMAAVYPSGKEGLDRLRSGEILPARQAVEEGWLAEMATPDGIVRRWKKEKFREASLPESTRGYGRGPRIAVLIWEGGIGDGRSRQDPLTGQVLGAESFLPHIEALRKDRRVKGVVFRIHCPGGSPTASEEVARALEALAEEKPLAVSFGGVAGSGGYWIAAAGRQIFTEATSLTGSVGVIALFFQFQGLMKSWGIGRDTIQTDPVSDLGAPHRPMTSREKRIMEGRIDHLYREFLHRAAAFRRMEPDELEPLAGGRVWSGRDAAARGLADRVGGLADAVDFIRREAGLTRNSVRFYPRLRRGFLQRQLDKQMEAALSSGLSGGAGSIGLTGMAGQTGFLSREADGALRALRTMEFLLDSWGRGAPLLIMPEVLPLFRNI